MKCFILLTNVYRDAVVSLPRTFEWYKRIPTAVMELKLKNVVYESQKLNHNISKINDVLYKIKHWNDS